MKLTRRGFFGGIAASIAAACLPKVKVEQPPPVTMPTQWTQFVYGAPIIYYPKKWMIIMEENL